MISLLILAMFKLLDVHRGQESAISDKLSTWNRMIMTHCLFVISNGSWKNFVSELRWLFEFFLSNRSLSVLKWSSSSFKSWSQINIFCNDASRQQTVHSVFDIILSNRRWLSKWIISVVLGKNSFRIEHLVSSSCTNAKFLELNVADASLSSAILENIGLRKCIFVSQELVASHILWIPCEIGKLLLSHMCLNRLWNLL